MGYISDLTNIQRAFIVPLLCYVYIFYFAARDIASANRRETRNATLLPDARSQRRSETIAEYREHHDTIWPADPPQLERRRH